jgi:hypothetical protein
MQRALSLQRHGTLINVVKTNPLQLMNISPPPRLLAADLFDAGFSC